MKLSKEPAVLIGLALAVLTGLQQVLVDGWQTHDLLTLLPLVTGLLIRPTVSPVAHDKDRRTL